MPAQVEVIDEMCSFCQTEETIAKENLQRVSQKNKEILSKLRKIPVIFFWDNPLKWLRREYLSLRRVGLRKEVRKWRARLKLSITAQQEIKKGNYKPAIRVLNALLERTPDVIYYCESRGVPNPIFWEIIALRGQLLILQGGKK